MLPFPIVISLTISEAWGEKLHRSLFVGLGAFICSWLTIHSLNLITGLISGKDLLNQEFSKSFLEITIIEK